MKVSVTFSGGKEMAKRLAELSPSRQAQRKALVQAGEPMRRRMGQLAPLEPGKPDLRDAMLISAASSRTDREIFPKEIAVAIGPSRAAFYGSFQEYGTAFHPAQPFARPAFDEFVQTTVRLLADAFWAVIRKAAAKGQTGSARGRASGVGV